MKVGVISVATNIYRKYWHEMVRSYDSVCNGDDDVTFYVFTDDVEFCNSIKKDLANVKVKALKIKKIVWPEATLLRYKLITDNASKFTEDLLFHVDADMWFHKDFLQYLPKIDGPKVFLVNHPGYWRPEKFYTSSRIKFLNVKIRDAMNLVLFGSLGQWERNRFSTAFVPRKLRKNYFCGGVWGGTRSEILQLSFQLKENIEVDRDRKVMARWHDESHLNHWAAFHEFESLTPSFCYYPEYKYLIGIENLIEAVNKGQSFYRIQESNQE